MPGFKLVRRGAWAILGVVLLMLARPSVAQACYESRTVVKKVLGVAPDGSFVVADEHEGDRGDGPIRRLVRYDALGVQIESLEGDFDQRSWLWNLEIVDRSRRSALADVGGSGQSFAQVQSAAMMKLDLTPIVPAAAARHAHTGVRCGSLELSTPDGWVRVADVGEVDLQKEICPPITVHAFQHPDSGFVFVRVEWHIRDGLDHADIDEMYWFPERRVRGLRAAARADSALKNGNPGLAISLYEDALRLAPEYYPTRRGLIEAFAGAGAAWPPLEALLRTPFPEGQNCIAFTDHPALGDRIPSSPPWPDASSLNADDMDWPWDKCRIREGYFDLSSMWAPPAPASSNLAGDGDSGDAKDSDGATPADQGSEPTGDADTKVAEPVTPTATETGNHDPAESTHADSPSGPTTNMLVQQVLSFAQWLGAALFGAIAVLLGSWHGARLQRGRKARRSGSPYRDAP